MKSGSNKISFTAVSVLAFCAWATTVQAQDSISGSASFNLIGKTDSEQTLGRHYTVVRYLDEKCAKPKRNSRLYREKYVEDIETFDTIDIATTEPFIFQVDYEEKRRDTERSCSAAAGFTPVAGRRYRGEFKVSGQVSRCEITLFDVTEGEVEFPAEIVPETMCTRRGATGNGNGVPTHAMIDRF
ncbi:hypothetical protein [Arenicella xantha]|uniref:Uncharacterized protein n=1 Tax=Arenicella xantha TaxID=644221 RepID=A0A395JQW9_9GAMM|nr:hypothetical protein [Arenicella xantha]RBP52846.1 hypothetical protein DFR28_101230 [Arenicella xantha]